MAFFHEVDRWPRQGCPWSTGIASSEGKNILGKPAMAQRQSARGLILLLVWFAIGSAHLPAAEPTPEDFEFFESHVRPIFLEHCAACHSRQAGEPEAGLSLDSQADFLNAQGIALPGRPDESLLVQAVRYDGDLQMPPEGKLPAAAIGVIEEWVQRPLIWPSGGQSTGAGSHPARCCPRR